MTNQTFKRVKGIRLSDQAVEQIQALIMDGQIEPGSKLPSEGELASQLQISRASIREALRILESRGVIQVRSGSGAYVSELPFSFNALTDALEWLVGRKETLVHLLAVREVLEGFACSLVAQQATDEVVAKLLANLEERRQVAAGSRDVDQLSAIDLEFHQIIAENCGNPVAKVIIQSILSQICCSNRAIVRVSGGSDISTAEHQAIMEALKACDPVQAEQAMRAHLSRVRLELAEIHEQADGEVKDRGVISGI